MIEVDAGWLADNPLPSPNQGGDKEARGRVLVVGGSAMVPGAIALTGETALRVGAGKLKLATIASAAMTLGIGFREAAVMALPEAEGEIAAAAAPMLAEAATRTDVLVLGPGMMEQHAAAALIRALATVDAPDATLVLDAAAVACAGSLDELLGHWRGRLVMTPHVGEMAALLDRDADGIKADLPGAAAVASSRFDAVVVLKDEETFIAAPDGTVLHYRGGGPGLGTGGSGDVLAGVIGGLVARGVSPIAAAGWGVWLHGEAGRTLGERIGPVGFLARELLPVLPTLLPRTSARD